MTASVSAPLLAVRRAVGAAALTAWICASLRGGASADDVVDAAARMGMRQLRMGADSEPVLLGLAGVRGEEWRHARLVLPAAGDPSGLPGPAELNARAIAAGTAILLTRPDQPPAEVLFLLPCGEDAWQATAVPLPYSVVASWPTVRQARAEFITAIAGHSAALTELDVAGDALGLRDMVLDEDEQPLPDLPPDFSDDRRELLGRARLVAVLAAAAQADQGRSVSAAEATSRAAHLRALATIARRAIAASVSQP